MKEQIKQFVADKRGVSPVIGVVLMVAVVVILAAVIGAFVLGLGGSQTQAPQASFSLDADTSTLTMTGGDNLNGDNLEVVVAGGAATNPFPTDTTAGTSVTLGTTPATGDTVTVNWVPADGSESATLFQTTV